MLRDREAVLTKEGLIFRVYGYFHPPEAYVCDVEYAPSSIYKSKDPRAFRSKGKQIFYKFYADEGLQFVKKRFPKYAVFYEPLEEFLVGTEQQDIWEVRRPDEKLEQLLKIESKDDLIKTLHKVLHLIMCRSKLQENDFGVFGSLLHGFYHPKFSDIDLVVYGQKKLQKLQEILLNLYSEEDSPIKNEFETEKAIEGKTWKFTNYTPKEYLWHQMRKLIYGQIRDYESGRFVKVEFEPVKNWNEIHNEYSPDIHIQKKGWISMTAIVKEDFDSPFIPSIYTIEPIKIFSGPKAENIQRVVSYVEEFRMQVRNDEKVYVEGNLEEVITPSESSHEITLTYCPRYYEQVLKTI